MHPEPMHMSDADQFPNDSALPADGAVMDDASTLDGPDADTTTRERQEAHLRGQADMLKGMIDALDDIGRFAHVDPATTDAKTVVDGVDMVEKKLLKTLSGHGLEIVNPEGQPFDPALHEAVMTEPAATKEEDHLVARVFQVGYLFNGQLLRPARVVVKQWNG
jgi:molecular chaperone GrpE